MNIVEIKKVAGNLKSALFKNSNSFSIGMLRSHFKGTGLQFKEHQVYAHGDDVRFIDWKMMAKTNKPYIKTFEEERNVEITVVIDATSSMYSGFNGVSKLQAAIEICCLLYILARETGDHVHAIIIGQTITMVPKKSGDDGIVHLVSALERANVIDKEGNVLRDFTPENILTQDEKLLVMMPHLARKREIVLLSDFNDFLDIDTLKKLLYRSNVHCFQLLSPLDEATNIPFNLYCKQNPNSKSGSLSKLDFDGNKEFQNPFGKKFKKLKVHERYLEKFIKEML